MAPRTSRRLGASFKWLIIAILLTAPQAARASTAPPCTATTPDPIMELRALLTQVARHGLSRGHYYEVTFRTSVPGVVVPASERAKYPEAMTIVLQHRFERLVVSPDGFGVDLWFKGVKTRVDVPFAAVTHLADPSRQDLREFSAPHSSETCDAR